MLRRAAVTSNPHKRTAVAPALLALVTRGAYGLTRDKSYADRSLVEVIHQHLGEIQDTFIALLKDPKSGQLARESCCLGLVSCHTLATFSSEGLSNALALNQRLLKAFGQTTNYGGSAMMETAAQANERRRVNSSRSREGTSSTVSAMMEGLGVETQPEVGGTSGLGEAALGAFREMAGAAVALERPDILYFLIALSVAHPALAGRYNVSTLLGGKQTNSVEMREALRPQMSRLLPRLLRARHDPNAETRERMSNLFVGVIGSGAEARSAVTKMLIPTIDALISDASSSKLWRCRFAALSALSETIVGRYWQELGGGTQVLHDEDILDSSNTGAGARMLRLWRVAMRALDDVRGNVREVGEKFCRTLKSLTIRLCDPSAVPNGVMATKTEIAKHEREASYAAATALRYLLKHGLNQSCAEAVGCCVSCITGIVDVANPKILEALIPDLLRSLLIAISGLEPAALSYLQVRAAGQDGNSASYDRLERLRLQLANTGPLATAVSKCLDILPGVDLETQKLVIPKLDEALRSSAGFASRAATADACSMLVGSCPSAFKFGGSSTTNPSVRLLRALYYASERETGEEARRKMAHAFGNLASVCPPKSVRSIALRAAGSYNKHFGNFDSVKMRKAAAFALRSIAVRASNQFSDGGNTDVWCRRVLPVAFLGMEDSDPTISSLWKEVWDEGGSAANLSGAADDFGSLLEEKLLPSLVSECVRALDSVEWIRRVAGSIALCKLARLNILAPAPRRLNSSSISIEDMERSRRRAQASNSALVALVKLVAGPRLWSGKADITKAAVLVASKWSGICSDVDQICAMNEIDSELGVSPLRPIAVAPGKFKNDLFIGDGWFAADSNTEMDDAEGQSQENEIEGMNIDDDTTEMAIDFEEGDTLLEGENQAEDEHEGDGSSHGVVTFTGLCLCLVNQAFPSSERSWLSVSESEVLPYRAEVLKALKELLDSTTNGAQKQEIFQSVFPKLISVFDADGRFHFEKSDKGEEPPLIVARSIDCLGSCLWDGIGEKESTPESPTVDALELIRVLQASGGSGQAAWTVRESAALCTLLLVKHLHTDALRHHGIISAVVECASQAMKDRKFWRVRHAGLKVARALVSRAGDAAAAGNTASNMVDSDDRQLILEAVLPHKESILRISRKALSDSEAKVTALSSEILSAMSWWP